jgi:hypothetical protein
MEKQNLAPATPAVKIPKAEAIETIAKKLAAIRVSLVAAQALKAAAVKPERYALHFQVNELKSQANHWKAQIARLKKEAKTEVDWAREFGN